MKKRKICIVITSRASYSRIKTLISAIINHSKCELQLILSASALVDKYGNIETILKQQKIPITAKIYNVLEGNSTTISTKITALGMIELSSVFAQHKPDIVVTIGDRYETMSTAITATYMNIPLAHIQGGEVSGNIDEKVRHSITKLADYHFVSTLKSKERVLKLGERLENVFLTGCPSIDLANQVINSVNLDFNPFQKYGGVGSEFDLSKGYYIVLQHPVTTEAHLSKQQIEITLNAMKNLDIPVLWFWPNIDYGTNDISKAIREFREQNKENKFHFFIHIESIDFLKLLFHSKAIIGNSSVGIREASYLSVPVINIGRRQIYRECAQNVIHVNHDIDEIQKAIKKIQTLKPTLSTLYGNGNAGKTIAEILSYIPLQIKKHLTF